MIAPVVAAEWVNAYLREHLQVIYAAPRRAGETQIQTYLNGLQLPHLTTAQVEELEEEVPLDDLGEALSGMATGKAPDPDGLPVEFYCTYSAVLLPRLLKILHEARGEGLLPVHMREALIVMLPKPGKEVDDPSSYRPLSMLNVDVKLLAKVLASKLRSGILTLLATKSVLNEYFRHRPSHPSVTYEDTFVMPSLGLPQTVPQSAEQIAVATLNASIRECPWGTLKGNDPAWRDSFREKKEGLRDGEEKR
ncbi:hypothetical protein NDU88_005463 [Pleurodeles waltl]|uniref:Uncharacterized protein n=1 Tax=Pleurodeles waltl TaxID=8319 RepID=A0AAV7TUW0_PLEWA|nr:hypothetical protein NDU88_005463 [Pleurodeles waltl]